MTTVTLSLEWSFDFDDEREPLHEDDMRERAIDMFMDLIRKDSDTIVREEIQFVRMEHN
jgi:hypothetical protein